MARLMRYRPYFACGRSQLRIGIKRRDVVFGQYAWYTHYHWIGLTWQ